ncbi:MAG: Hpt domain-containing protein [Bacteroidales bacterium]
MDKILFDFTYLDDLSEDDKEFKADMINVFLESAPASIREMQTFYKNKNWNSLREVAHKYKPQLGFMGIYSIMHDVEQIEQISTTKTNLDKLPELIENVEKVSKIASEQIKKEMKID